MTPDFEGARYRAISIWLRFNRRINLDDLKAQAALLALQGKEGRELWCDLFDYAEYEHRRRPFRWPKAQPSYSWHPACCFVRRAVDGLPLRQSKAVRLIYFEDYLRVEAAYEMGITKAAITHLIGRALSNLKLQLQTNNLHV